jgi:hypothetical protein
MMISQLAPHRLAAPPPRRSARLPEGAECPHGVGDGCERCLEEAEDDGGSMKEVASLQVGFGVWCGRGGVGGWAAPGFRA